MILKKLKFVLLGTTLAVTLGLVGCSEKESQNKPLDTGISIDEISNEAFKDKFPLQYNSVMSSDDDATDTTYGGNIKRSKFDHDKEPYLPILFNGFGFATDYNEDRGHTFANEDLISSGRVNEKSPGSCLTCKSSAAPALTKEMGEDYYGSSLKEVIYPKAESMGHSAIGCSDCHNPKTMELRITREPFIKGMADRGIDVSKASLNDMRSYVCAQCHVEYHFSGEKKVVTFPWKNGFDAEDIYKYYTEQRSSGGFQSDFSHGVSATPVIKAQHPEYETYSEGTHGKAGVSCSDCHMQYERKDGKKYSSHNWTSPLKTLEQSCRTCHSDKSVKELKASVLITQEKNIKGLHEAEEISVKAHYFINKMISVGVSKQKIEEAQEYVRKGQWFWDFVAAENGAGFHNPQGAMDNLRKSSIESNKAIELATEELVKKKVDLIKLKHEIEGHMKKVYNEPESSNKKVHVSSEVFPTQIVK